MTQSPHVQYVRSADGTSIAFCEIGDGVPLIISCNLWDDLWTTTGNDQEEHPLRRLARDGFHAVRYNMRGTGMSDRDVTDFRSMPRWRT